MAFTTWLMFFSFRPAKLNIPICDSIRVTKTRIQPRTPGWAFVMNFEVFDGASPRGCLMLYRVVYAPTDFVPVTCKVVGVGNQISFTGGRGVFNGLRQNLV